MGYPDKMRQLCALRRLDQATLAERVGISRSTISRILSGVQEPKLRLAWKLAQELEVSLDFLADDSAEQSPGITWSRLSLDELTILKLVRRLGVEEAMDRLLGIEREPGEASKESGSSSDI